MRPFVAGLLLFVGCDLVPGPPVPLPRAPTEAPPTAALVGLGNPFADVYPAEYVLSKGWVHDVAAVDGRVYLGHGSTNSHTPVRPVYYDIGAGRWGVDDVNILQEGMYDLQVGPSGRLYGSADDAHGTFDIDMIRRERDGTWTQRGVGNDGHHSRDTYEWVDPQTGETLVFVHNAAAHFPDISVSYDGGESFVAYGREDAGEVEYNMFYCKFFSFRGELYAAGLTNQGRPGGSTPPPRPYLARYTRDRDRPFEVVAGDRSEVFPAEGSQITEATELNGRLIAASNRFYSGDALTSDRMTVLPIEGRANDLLHVGGEVFLLAGDHEARTSTVYVTTDGRTVEEVATFDRLFVALEYVDGAFYFAESGGDADHTLWRYEAAR